MLSFMTLDHLNANTIDENQIKNYVKREHFEIMSKHYFFM